MSASIVEEGDEEIEAPVPAVGKQKDENVKASTESKRIERPSKKPKFRDNMR